MGRSLPIILAALCGWITGLQASDDVILTIRQIDPIPRPMQPVCIEVSVGWRGKESRTIKYPEQQIHLLDAYQDGSGDEWQPIDQWHTFSPVFLRDRLDQFIAATKTPICARQEFILQFAVPLNFREGGRVQKRSFRPSVNDVAIRTGYEPFAMRRPEDEAIQKVIRLRVDAIHPEDEPIVQHLTADKAMREALFMPGSFLNERRVEGIKALIAAHPKSSYTKFARYALARWHARPVDVPGESKSVEHDPKAALEELDRIDMRGFAFAANALSYKRWLQEKANPAGAIKTGAELDSKYTNWFDRLLDLAHRVKTAEEWKAKAGRPTKADVGGEEL